MIEDGPFRDALEYIADHPLWPTQHVAAVLHQDHAELLARLEAAARVAGWLKEEVACCGKASRFSITQEGLAALGPKMEA